MTMAVNTNHDSLRQQLQAGADALALGLSDAQVGLLMDFLALLQKWNTVSYTHLTLPTTPYV